MSHPKRYNMAWTAKVEDPEQGAWIEYDDYAALAAENERMSRLLLDLSNAVHIHRANANTSKCDAEINRIVAEVDDMLDIE